MSDEDEIENETETENETVAEAEAPSEEEGVGGEEAVDLEDLEGQTAGSEMLTESEEGTHSATELEPVFDVPVTVQAVLGKSHLEVSQLLKLGPGAIIELDRKVGEAIDIYVNDRLVARGEVVLVEDHLGVTMTEIIKGGSN
jgi:flagellar motor switch protein FliN/FliY